MNGVEGFVIGMICGIISTFAGIMTFAKYMTKSEKNAAIKAGKEKLDGHK